MRLQQAVKSFLSSEDGPAGVEYAIMLALIIVVCIATINPLGLAVEMVCDSVCEALGRKAG